MRFVMMHRDLRYTGGQTRTALPTQRPVPNLWPPPFFSCWHVPAANCTTHECLDVSSSTLAIFRFYAPFCKACRSFGIKFRKLASLRGDRTNAAGTVVKRGDFRFGEVEYSGNVRLCKELSIRTFPAVLIYHRAGGGGMVGVERSREVICGPAIEGVISDIDRLNLVENFSSQQ